MMGKVALLCLLFITLMEPLAAQQKIGFELSAGRKQIDIPFEVYNNLIVVNVTLNRVVPVKFIVDTGVKTSILSEKIFLDILNVNYDRRVNIVGAAGGEGVEAFVANNVKLEMPGLICHGMSIFVFSEDYLRLGSSLGVSVQGILGSELFNRFVVRFDYSKRIMTLFEPEFYRPSRKCIKIPITIEDSKPYFMATVTQSNQTNVITKLLIDTGASHSIMLHETSDSTIFLPEMRIRSLLGRGLGGEINGYVGRVDSVKLASFKFSSVICSFPDEISYQGIIAETKRQGTVGGGLMSKFLVSFDYNRNCMYLRKSPYYKRPFEADMSGLDLIATGFNLKTILVADVRENTPAAVADIRKGDVIVKLGWYKAGNLTLNQVNGLLHSKSSRTIKLKIMRDKQMINTSITLRRLI